MLDQDPGEARPADHHWTAPSPAWALAAASLVIPLLLELPAETIAVAYGLSALAVAGIVFVYAAYLRRPARRGLLGRHLSLPALLLTIIVGVAGYRWPVLQAALVRHPSPRAEAPVVAPPPSERTATAAPAPAAEAPTSPQAEARPGRAQPLAPDRAPPTGRSARTSSPAQPLQPSPAMSAAEPPAPPPPAVERHGIFIALSGAGERDAIAAAGFGAMLQKGGYDTAAGPQHARQIVNVVISTGPQPDIAGPSGFYEYASLQVDIEDGATHRSLGIARFKGERTDPDPARAHAEALADALDQAARYVQAQLVAAP